MTDIYVEGWRSIRHPALAGHCWTRQPVTGARSSAASARRGLSAIPIAAIGVRGVAACQMAPTASGRRSWPPPGSRASSGVDVVTIQKAMGHSALVGTNVAAPGQAAMCS